MAGYRRYTPNLKLAPGFRDKLSSANKNLKADAGAEALVPERVTALGAPLKPSQVFCLKPEINTYQLRSKLSVSAHRSGALKTLWSFYAVTCLLNLRHVRNLLKSGISLVHVPPS